MERENPFTILGIDQNLVEKLSDQEISLVIESQYKTLQKIFHPDKGGDNKSSQEINWAKSELDDKKQAYKYFKQKFLKKSPAKKRIENLQNQINNYEIERQSTFNTLNDYISAYQENTGKNNIFHLKDLEISLLDSVRIMNYPGRFECQTKKEKKNFMNKINIDEYGNIIFLKGKKKIDCANKTIIAGVDYNDIKLSFGSIEKLAQDLQPFSWTSKQEITRRIGKEKERIFPQEIVAFENKITLDRIYPIINFFKPSLSKDDYLIMLNTEKNETYFSIEGHITRLIEKS